MMMSLFHCGPLSTTATSRLLTIHFDECPRACRLLLCHYLRTNPLLILNSDVSLVLFLSPVAEVQCCYALQVWVSYPVYEELVSQLATEHLPGRLYRLAVYRDTVQHLGALQMIDCVQLVVFLL